MTTALLALTAWLALAVLLATTWATIRGRQKTTAAARQHHTTEALREARARLADAATAPQSGQRA